MRKEVVQDCLEFKWVVYDSTPQAVYQSTEVVSASGTMQGTSSTVGMNYVTVNFLIGTTAVASFTLANKQSRAFTVVGFDTVTLTGNALSPSESAAGILCLNPRYELF